MARERIILIDGSGYIFRAFYAIQKLSNSKGEPTNAVYGFVNMLLKVLEDEQPTKLAIMFDTAVPSFRKDLFDAYKGNREKPPEDLIPQFAWIQEAVDCFGIQRMQMEGFEADDLIATVAEKAQKDGYQVEIITGDKDLMQLVNDRITLYDTMKGKRIGRAEVVEKFQVQPEQVVDILALMGDTSDNIPGVSGIGAKTAAELVGAYGSLDGIYQNLDSIKQPKRRATLEEQKAQAYMSQKLATVKRDVPLAMEWDAFNYSGPKRDLLQAFFERMEFRGLIKRFGMAAQESILKGADYQTLNGETELRQAVEALRKCPWVAVDTETTSLAIHTARCVGISLCGEPGQAYYIPFGHGVPGAPDDLAAGQLPQQAVREALRPLLEDPSVLKVGQNLKYDMQILRAWGIDLQGTAADTLIESYLLDPDGPHNLDALAQKHLGHQTVTYADVAGSGKSQISFAEVSIEKATQYAAEDADVTLRLHQILSPRVESLGMGHLYQKVEVPLIECLAQMEYQGVLVHKQALERMSVELEGEMQDVEKRIYLLAGETFNVHSPKQLSKILFEKLGLPVIKKTKTGVSTDESVLVALEDKHEICAQILKSRAFAKLKSTYVDGLLAQIHPRTGRVHTNYNQTVAATGRLSSSNPNLQNIPVAPDPKYDVRSVFICPEGSGLLSVDYSQIELRLLADMSEDKELVRAFENDEDVHAFTGKLIFGCETVTPEQRRVAKTINFGVVYGQTPFGLSQTLKIPQSKAKHFIDTYFERYSGVRKCLQALAQSAREKGYAQTRMGRRRPIPEINSQNRMRREMAERTAINMPLQGTAADLIKCAMVAIHRRLREEKLKSRMILQVHDELVFEVPVAERQTLERLVREEMEGAMQLKVPLKVDMGWGANWHEAK